MKKKFIKPNIIFYSYSILLIVILFFSLYFGEYILWLSFMFLTSVLLVDLLFFSLFILTVKVRQKALTSVSTRLTKLDIKFEIKSNPLFFININHTLCYINSSKKQQFAETSRNTNKISLFPNKIGSSYFGLEYIVFKSFFGIFSKKFYLNKNNNKKNCLITPIQKEFKLSPVLFKRDNLQGNLSSPKKGNEDFIGARPYVYGDSLRKINFKKSSVLKKAIVNEYDSPNSSLIANIYIGKSNKQNYTEVAEAVLAIYSFYKSSNIHDCSLNFWNGQVFNYSEDSKNSISLDLAKFEPELFDNSIDFNYKNTINALVISKYNEKSFFEFTKNIGDGTIIFITKSAMEHKNKIVEQVNKQNNSILEIFVLTENDYLN